MTVLSMTVECSKWFSDCFRIALNSAKNEKIPLDPIGVGASYSTPKPPTVINAATRRFADSPQLLATIFRSAEIQIEAQAL